MQPLLSLVPESGWYKSKGHQMRWLHQLSFLEGADRYAASLTYFYFNREARQNSADTRGPPAARRDVGRSRNRGSLPGTSKASRSTACCMRTRACACLTTR